MCNPHLICFDVRIISTGLVCGDNFIPINLTVMRFPYLDLMPRIFLKCSTWHGTIVSTNVRFFVTSSNSKTFDPQIQLWIWFHIIICVWCLPFSFVSLLYVVEIKITTLLWTFKGLSCHFEILGLKIQLVECDLIKNVWEEIVSFLILPTCAEPQDLLIHISWLRQHSYLY